MKTSDYSIVPAELLADAARETCWVDERDASFLRVDASLRSVNELPPIAGAQAVHDTRLEVAETLEEIMRNADREGSDLGPANLIVYATYLSRGVRAYAAALRKSMDAGELDPTVEDE